MPLFSGETIPWIHNRYCSRVQDIAGQGCGRANYDAIRSFIRLAFSLVSTGVFWYEGCKTIKRCSHHSTAVLAVSIWFNVLFWMCCRVFLLQHHRRGSERHNNKGFDNVHQLQ